ncbi:DUF2332 domain-containing protein [Nocardioides insulae]|uniref:DUF2332 domain-containing protein n=1 Tax=Nocardioides insulae TaxID=394734 RepID=UPI001FE10C82|nr:DUF2332 domain-containing protein [Nocardioides insulae]
MQAERLSTARPEDLMRPVPEQSDIAASYRDHAAMMADSPCFAEWAARTAEDPEVLAVLATLPTEKQQANLVFAAARWHGVPAPGPYAGLRAALLGPDQQAILDTVRTRRTQTNEVGRLTALTPALATLGEGPFALVELGTSAGLCLHPDGFDYDWGVGTLTGSGGPVLDCSTRGALPVPDVHPRIAARIGVDQHPLDVRSEEDMDWLLTLVWPEQEGRRARLRAAVEVARRSPAQLLGGDLFDRLEDALALAESSGAVPVVQHSAVIAYLEEPDRARFHERMSSLVAAGRCHWISLEGQTVLPRLTATGPAPSSPHPFCLAVDGQAVAWAHGHGRTLSWFG